MNLREMIDTEMSKVVWKIVPLEKPYGSNRFAVMRFIEGKDVVVTESTNHPTLESALHAVDSYRKLVSREVAAQALLEYLRELEGTNV